MKVVSSLAALLMMAPTAARADGWLVAETPAAVAVSDAQAGVFKPGVMPAVGAYIDNGWFALGARLRAGVLRDAPPPGGRFRDPGLGGLTTASVAARIHAFGGWIEGAAGGGMTGSDIVPAVEVGAGWAFDLGSFEMGPSIRYARITSTGDMDTLGSASLVLVGIDMRFGRDHAKSPRRSYPRIEAPIVVEESHRVDRDHDRIVEHEPSCAEVLDGCTFGKITVVDDRIVFDDHVFFDLDRARVRTKGRAIVQAIAALWSEHPEWTSITIEGHTDVRGSDDYNLRLSQLRADRVREVLVEAGADPTRLGATGFGRTRPRDTNTDERAHQNNRRVEFVIERRTEKFQ